MINWNNIPVSNIKLGTAVKVISTTTFKYWLAIQYRTAHVFFKQNFQQQIQRGPFSLVAEGNLVLPLSLSRHEPVVRQTHWGSRPRTVGHVMCQSGGLRWRAGGQDLSWLTGFTEQYDKQGSSRNFWGHKNRYIW